MLKKWEASAYCNRQIKCFVVIIVKFYAYPAVYTEISGYLGHLH